MIAEIYQVASKKTAIRKGGFGPTLAITTHQP
jgi:hypothetical protein